MKRIALISLHTPTCTNCRGASALPYHLIAFRNHDIEIEIWSYNLNGCAQEQILDSERNLNLKIHLIDKPKWFRLLSLAPIRLILPKPMLGYLPLPKDTVAEINQFLKGNQSALWIYGEDIAHLAHNFSKVRTVITTPDCEAMYYHRVLAMKGVPLRIGLMARYALMYHRYARMAATFPVGENIKYHLVGKEDTLFLRRLNPRIDVRFINHPHYDMSPFPHADVKGGEPIKILIAGRYDFSMAQAVDEAIDAMKSLPTESKDKFMITFLGKGWEGCCEILRESGFDSQLKGYVDDYAAEVSSHHIQLTPVAVGTGTKGKVLDAFANGLMVIGTPLALENIAIRDGVECVEYTSVEELTSWLGRIATNPELVNEMAHAGTKAVLSKHSRTKIAKQFFDLFN